MPQIDLVQGMMDCLYAKCIPCITDCVLAELEKLGQKYRVALRVAKVQLRSVPTMLRHRLHIIQCVLARCRHTDHMDRTTTAATSPLLMSDVLQSRGLPSADVWTDNPVSEHG